MAPPRRGRRASITITIDWANFQPSINDMTPDSYGERKAVEVILMYVLRDFLSREKNPQKIVDHIREHLVSVEGLDDPACRKAAMEMFEWVVGPALNNVLKNRDDTSDPGL
jgi:hypothetical protein